MNGGHIVLLGDSIFDNAAYVPDGPSVIEHLQRGLPNGWKATLLGVDGSVTPDIPEQLPNLPGDATHLVISTGGNDALHHGHLIRYGPADAISNVMGQMESIRQAFHNNYVTMLADVIATGKPFALCTIYDAIPDLEPGERAGLCLFNDIITREAFRVGAHLIDLRLVCSERSDYASQSPIEPSRLGGAKIARAIMRAVVDGDCASRRTTV